MSLEFYDPPPPGPQPEKPAPRDPVAYLIAQRYLVELQEKPRKEKAAEENAHLVIVDRGVFRQLRDIEPTDLMPKV